MSLSKIICSIAFLALSYSVHSCTCGQSNDNSFCQTASSSTNVAIVTVIEEGIDYSNSWPAEFIVVSVIENLHNQIQEDTLTIWGQDGVNCGAYVASNFSVGDSLIVGLNIYHISNYFLGNVIDNYTELSYCGTEYLRLNNNTVTGAIAPNVTALSLNEFKSNIDACIGMSRVFSSALYPNPASEEVTVIIESVYPLPHSINVVSNDGKVCKTTALTLDGKVKIDVSNLANGMYYIEAINAEGIIARMKFVKK